MAGGGHGFGPEMQIDSSTHVTKQKHKGFKILMYLKNKGWSEIGLEQWFSPFLMPPFLMRKLENYCIVTS